MTFRRNPEFMASVKGRFAQRLTRAGEKTRDNIVSLIEEPKDGPQYPGVPNRSSEPGQPPASQSGELAESIRVDGPVIDDDQVAVHVNSPLFKARLLEAGTVSLAPRPFMLPGLLSSENDIKAAMRGEGVSDG
jgi:hypothetical protein